MSRLRPKVLRLAASGLVESIRTFWERQSGRVHRGEKPTGLGSDHKSKCVLESLTVDDDGEYFRYC